MTVSVALHVTKATRGDGVCQQFKFAEVSRIVYTRFIFTERRHDEATASTAAIVFVSIHGIMGRMSGNEAAWAVRDQFVGVGLCAAAFGSSLMPDPGNL